MTILGMAIPVPAEQELLQTNAVSGYGSLGAQADTCIAQHGYAPTFTLVDYYDMGNGSVFRESGSGHLRRFPRRKEALCDTRNAA